MILERKFGSEQRLELLLRPKLELVPEFGLKLVPEFGLKLRLKRK